MKVYLERRGYSYSTATVHKYMNTELGLHSIVRPKKLNMSTENRIKYSTINLIRISQQMKSTGNGVRILHICSFRIMRYATTVPY